MATSSEIEEFMQGPLVTWLKSCLDNADKLQSYDDLTDGTLIHQVFLSIDPEPVHHTVTPGSRNSYVRVRNMSNIIKNIKVLYEEELCQLIVALPDSVRLGQKPESKEGLEDMRLLLLLLLGCAVQCPNKHKFIEKIKALPVECQHTLVHCIQQVTESQQIVLSSDNCELLTTDLLMKHIRKLQRERDYYFQLGMSAFEEKRMNTSTSTSTGLGHSNDSQCQHLAGEIADWKTKLRKMRQELEEKSEALAEAKEELERSHNTISKLKSEMLELKQEARLSKAYRDEVDALREKAERCDRLDSEVMKYREKLGDLDYYKGRIEELRQDNRVLEETKEMVEEQLCKMKKRADYAVQLETDLVQLKRTIDELTLERDAVQEKLSDLLEENTQLQLQSKTNSNRSYETVRDDQLLAENLGTNDNLSEQLSSSTQTRLLKLELENKRLTSMLETLQDNTFHRTNERVLELEKEKKRLSLTVESLEDGKKKFMGQIAELETKVKETSAQLKRMQDTHKILQEQLELRYDDAEFSNKEKTRLKERIAELTNEVDNLKQKVDNASEVTELQSKINAMEKESTKLKRMAEERNVNLDRLSAENENLEKQSKNLLKQIEDLNRQLFRSDQIEKNAQELQKQHKIDVVTITNLENDLVSEKLKSQQLKDSFDALGLAIDNISDPDKVLERIASNPEVLKAVRERLDQEQPADEQSQISSLNNAKLQVNVITLQSQISSLTSQHTALQLANSQLVAEKEEALKELSKLMEARQQLVEDQKKLQTLHDQLNAEYDLLSKEREMLKSNLKDARSEKRSQTEKYVKLKAICNSLEADKENWQRDAESLLNLRMEHSKLKDDFRSLFQANEKLKIDYRELQEEYKKVRSEASKLKLNLTELQGELATRNETITTLELEISKLSNRCEMLVHTNNTLEEDRKSSMKHISMLFSQYHELLTHALEDKEYYHNEEKILFDKLNDIRRQKEKLEEKIMQSYRRSESCSGKKKGFGASIVRRMKKASSDFINKNRKSVQEELTEKQAADSDTSIEEAVPKQGAASDVGDNLSCLSVPGTRKTLYLSENETVDAEDTNANVSVDGQDSDEYCRSTSSFVEHSRTPTNCQDTRPPLLMYNRLTAKVGGKVTTSTPSPTPSQHSNKDMQPADNVKNSVWYEYGCV